MTMNAEILEENMRALPYFLVKISKIQFQNAELSLQNAKTPSPEISFLQVLAWKSLKKIGSLTAVSLSRDTLLIYMKVSLR